MDGYEATRTVFSKIQRLDPENASKIMGLLLIQDHGEKEMIRLAFGSEALLHSVIAKVKKELGISSNNSPPTPSTPLSTSPFLGKSSQLTNISMQNSSSHKVLGSTTKGINLPPSLTIPNPTSSSSSSSSSSGNNSSWGALSDLPNQDDLVISPGSGSLNPSSLPFYGNGGGSVDIMDDFQLQDQLSFLNENSTDVIGPRTDMLYPQPDLSLSPTGGADPILFPPYWDNSFHRRSSSISDVLGADDPSSGYGWRPCLYYARGYCKNGSGCRFDHGCLGDPDAAAAMIGADIGSPSKVELMDQCHDLLRSKSLQHHRFVAASQLMGGTSLPYSPKSMSFLLQQQQHDNQRAAAAAAAMMMGEDVHKLGRSRLERNDFSMNYGAMMVNPASRQIYLTFPADSTFREEDVSNYFSIYGPVQDVRIPYQQKRMFGFVTFIYPETVKIILGKGNPHFVCDARVLVKPYKEKGKVPEKYRKQQVERAELSPCGTPTGPDSRDPFDLQLGARMLYNTQDMLWRRKLEEQADLQQALELQSRRLMSLQLLDVNKHHHQRALSTGSPIPSPTQPRNIFNHSFFSPFRCSQEAPQADCPTLVPPISKVVSLDKQRIGDVSSRTSTNDEIGTGKGSPQRDGINFPESLEHNLPDSPFASPNKVSGEFFQTFDVFSNAEKDSSSCLNNSLAASTILPAANSTLDMATFNSFNCQMPRFSSGHGAIGMYAGTGGPTCPVGI